MKTFLKFSFYRILCPLLLFVGLDKVFRFFSRNRKLIIMYHGVSRIAQSSFNRRHLALQQFEKQVLYLTKNFKVVPLSDLCEAAKPGTSGRRSVALTFDDGYSNFVSNALPVLEKYKVPATVFISTASLETPDYIQPTDYLDLVNFASDKPIEISGKVFKKRKFDLVPLDGSARNAYEHVNSLGLSSWEEMFSDLRSRYPPQQVTRNIDPDLYRIMGGEELGRLLESELITVGSHAHLHVNLSALDDEQITDQLNTSKAILRNYGFDRVNILAFPFGNFDARVLSISQLIGFDILIGAGDIPAAFANRVFPRIGILNLGSFAYNMLSINRAFNRFGF